MRKRHHSGQSPARQYFYLHTAILRRALGFIPTSPTPQLDEFRRRYYTHHYLHKNLHSHRIILHTLKQQPSEAPEAEPNKMKL